MWCESEKLEEGVMTKAEKAAKGWVKELYKMFVNPGKSAGPKFNAATFDIERFLEPMISMNYGIRDVPEKSMKKALALARAEWNKMTKVTGGVNAVTGQ
jgi:hypothetical protein